MDASVKQKIIDILDQNRIMSLATLRPDGWPQATTVGFAHEGLTLYFLCGRDSQKTRNLEKDDRVSLTINADVPHVMGITGVSMAARAESIKEPGEAQRILGLLIKRYPEQADFPGPPPPADTMNIVRLRPQVISLIDYTKGFGHTDLIAVGQEDF
ncbi:MAG: pyridoxamine 5'-phosphate oxidase family protein [Devosia sp.]